MTKIAILTLFVALFTIIEGEQIMDLSCKTDYKGCTLFSTGETLPVQNLQCIGDICQNSFLIADDEKWYVCEHESERNGACEPLFKYNALELQWALLELLISNTVAEKKRSNEKRYLPYEAMLYGRKRRENAFPLLKAHYKPHHLKTNQNVNKVSHLKTIKI